jgi:hypothetical protein
MNKCRSILVAALVAALAAGRAAAQRPARGEPLPQLAQELFLAETVYSQERGEVQLTLHSRVEAGTHTRALAEYGVTDRLQLSLTTPVLERGAAEGEDEEAYDVGVMYALLPSAYPVELAVSVEASFAPRSAPQWEPALVAARGWGRLQLHGTVAGELDGEGQAVWGALAALVDAGRATPTLELVRSAEDEDIVVPGLFVHPAGGVEIGAGVPLCLSCSRRTEGFRAMVTVEF